MTTQIKNRNSSARNGNSIHSVPVGAFSAPAAAAPSGIATASAPLPRAQGAKQSSVMFRGTIPGKETLAKDYGEVLEYLDRQRPMGSAMLRGLLSRLSTSVERFEALQELARDQRTGEAQRVLDEIADLKRKRTEFEGAIGSAAKGSSGLPAVSLVLPFGVELASRPDPVSPSSAPPSGSTSGSTDKPSVHAPTATAAPVASAAASNSPHTAESVLPTAPVPVKSRSILSRMASVVTRPKLAALQAPAETLPISESAAFPAHEGHELAGAVKVTAVNHGAPWGSAAMESSSHRWPILIRFGRGMALVACGSVFGLSVGVLTGIIQPQIIAVAPEKALGPTAVLLSFGIFLFMAIGRAVFMLAALSAEERYEARLLGADNAASVEHSDPKKSLSELPAVWLARSATYSLITLFAVNLFLLVVESTVERYGVVRLVTDGMRNHFTVTGIAGANSGPGTFALTCLSLIISAPFLLIESVSGWVESREHAIKDFLTRHNEAAAHAIAKGLYNERAKAALQLETAKSVDSGVASGTAASQPTAVTVPAPQPVAAPEVQAGYISASPSAPTAPMAQTPSTPSATPVPSFAPEPLPQAASQPPSFTAAIANPIATEDTVSTPHEAAKEDSVGSVYRLRAAIAGIDNRIKDLTDNVLPKARLAMEAELSEAWGECALATHLFDKMLADERRSIGSDPHPGIVGRVWRYFAGRRVSR